MIELLGMAGSVIGAVGSFFKTNQEHKHRLKETRESHYQEMEAEKERRATLSLEIKSKEEIAKINRSIEQGAQAVENNKIVSGMVGKLEKTTLQIFNNFINVHNKAQEDGRKITAFVTLLIPLLIGVVTSLRYGTRVFITWLSVISLVYFSFSLDGDERRLAISTLVSISSTCISFWFMQGKMKK